jgi:PAS domain S-box-containing protein
MEMLGDKKGILKSIIKQLHEGADIQEIREKAKEILKDLTPDEISEVEQELVKEGITREEMEKLCDVHLEVFRESIERGSISVPEWHPLHILMEEHRILLNHARMLGERAERENGDGVREILEHLKEAEKHYLREENVLFPYIEKHGITEPPAIMWMEHDKIREMKKRIYSAAENGNYEMLKRASDGLAEMLSHHFYKENNILFPTALKVVEEGEWREIRREFDEIGYCCFIPEKLAHDEGKEEREDEGRISFPTGSLSKEEMEAMLDALPFDITFIDRDDRVRYFNQSKDRIFVRTKAIIGRKVQNCHPSKSVDVVNKILEEFKNGTKDRAEFWIDMDGRKIYIRYFPVRKDGEYIGTMEITQDITDIKKIEGQKRLLDWK